VGQSLTILITNINKSLLYFNYIISSLSRSGAGCGTRGLQSNHKAFNIINRQEDRNTGATKLTLDNGRQRLNETEGTKYTDESNIIE